MKKKLLMITLIIVLLIIILIIIVQRGTIETFKPDYPNDYDKIVIDHYPECWIIDDKDEIQNFIRYSKNVSEHIGEGPDWYVLKFIYKSKENYSIVYDDIGYPKKSIEVISKYIEETPKYYSYTEQEKGSFTYGIDYYLSYSTQDMANVFVFERQLLEDECKKNGLIISQ